MVDGQLFLDYLEMMGSGMRESGPATAVSVSLGNRFNYAFGEGNVEEDFAEKTNRFEEFNKLQFAVPWVTSSFVVKSSFS